jgi:CDP-glucose 4,6-dehydratase
LLATVRAGNVIGGGDWSEDRLIPDAIKAICNNNVLEIRSPNATRPWQHVLEPLSGYLLLGQKLLEGKKEFEQAYNFGPDNEGNKTVEKVLKEVKNNWKTLNWQAQIKEDNLHEANFLHLNCDKAKKIYLGNLCGILKNQ